MPTKIFVGRLSEGVTNDVIRELFRKFGKVVECDVVADYGFVHMESEEEAKAAISALDGYNINGSRISVEMSTASTQGRKRKMFDSSGPSMRGGPRGGPPGRPAPYGPRRDAYDAGPPPPAGRRPPYDMPPVAPVAPPVVGPRSGPPVGHQREEFASDQVKDLLELYIRDPTAFDQYARSYYYGERAERRMAAAAPYYDGRAPPPDRSYPMPASTYRR
jgi:RNA recognition motif-containing protein